MKKWKRICIYLLIFAFVITYADTSAVRVYAAEQVGVVTTQKENSTVNVRERATMNSTALCELRNKTEMVVLSSVTGEDGQKWYKIRCTHPTTGQTVNGYMRADYVTIKEAENSNNTENSFTATGKLTANEVCVRTGAGTNHPEITKLNRGHVVAIKGSVDVDGVKWYHVTGTSNGTAFDGYTCGLYISIDTQAGDTTSDYAQSLRNLGFPESYLPYLTGLHAQYPNWSFVPVMTGLDWNTVIKNESKVGSNLVSKTANDSQKSTAAGAYDWTTNTWKVLDGSNWVAANSDYIAYFMDPRNFLNDTDIFQFEALSFSSSQTLSGLKMVIGTSFLKKPVMDTDGSTLQYDQALMTIGREVNVSPYHLAARLIQEQGNAGTSSMISGTYSGYEGYFNYFNIKASGSGTQTVLTNGLKYAKQMGWNTRYKSIKGGASMIAKNYIGVGQDTLYFQKFDVIATGGLYSHQYMQNLKAAYSEGRKMAKAYTDKSSSFVFRIPVYNNMPASACTFVEKGNPNNYLSSLSITGVNLTPTFSGKTTEYSVIVPNATESIHISATAVASTSSVSGTGNYTLSVGDNVFYVKCHSQSKDVRTYTITVTRQQASSSQQNSTQNPSQDSSQTGNGEASISSANYRIEEYITGVAQGTEAKTFLSYIKTVNCSVKLLDSSGNENTSTVATGNQLVVYQGSTPVRRYQVVIFGDLNGDGKVSSIDIVRLYRYMNGIINLSGCYLQASDVNRDGRCAASTDMVRLYNYLNGKTTIKQ